MKLLKTVAIVSSLAEQDRVEHHIDHRYQCKLLNVVQGRYKGTNEPSYVIDFHDDLSRVKRFLIEHNQECALIRHSDRSCQLFYQDGHLENLAGAWQEVTKKHAETLDALTYDPKNDSYWAVI